MRAQNERLKKFFLNRECLFEHNICKMVKIFKKFAKFTDFAIFDHFGGPKSYKRGKRWQEIVI